MNTIPDGNSRLNLDSAVNFEVLLDMCKIFNTD